ncbi:hypothetical protein PTTG_28422 [Puccinia triticina 1-1 BBBD Race 1]|uniref:CCHC-type domain-containing protein n=1 Tax=Puccinia triticina (isolate 1-1 / race 1 (BBBD)) TaxID=630390 RepID=A0A180GCL4_PUCT1|nr:hypothetical protein PTTG_28422 [Puccinia triticina 1-1 BBBD Race 1]
MPAWTTQNPSALIANVPVLNGNSVGFLAWRARLEELFAIQGVHDIVVGKLLRPETDWKDAANKPITSGSQRVYYAKESGSDWDTLSDNTRARRMMLEDAFWSACHNPSKPIATWISRIRNSASDLKLVKLSPADQQISLEAHEVSMQVSFDQTPETFASPAVVKKKKKGCWKCHKIGHHLDVCPNPPAKNQPKARFETRAGAVSTVALGDRGPSDEEEDEDDFDPEVDVVWG